jgi:hypothetical protein
MTFNAQVLAQKKSQENGLDEASWFKVFDSAQQTLKDVDVDYQIIEYIALASRTPEQFAVMARLIYQYIKSNASGEQITEIILTLVNQSPFALGDWIDSVHYFYQWLLAHRKKIDFVPMLQYLECCVASPDAKKGRHTLLALVEDMLAVHGYEAG